MQNIDLTESDNDLLKACYKSVKDLVNAGFKKTKKHYEQLLANHIVELDYVDKAHPMGQKLICTANARCIALYTAKNDTDLKKAVRTPFVGMPIADSFNVRVYDLIACSTKTLTVKQIKFDRGMIIQLSESNAELVNSHLKLILKESRRQRKSR